MSNINALLAQGFNPMGAGRRANALMHMQQLDAGEQKNALMQFQMQQAQAEQAAQAQAQQQAGLLRQQKDAEFSRMQGGGKLDPLALLRLGVPKDQIEFMANAGNLGRQEVARVEERRGADGNPERVMFDKFGGAVGGALPQAVKMQLENMGGNSLAINPYALQAGQQFKRTQTPDSIASNATAMRGQNLTDARAREDFDLKKQAAAGGKTTVEERNAAGFSSRMAEATKLLDKFEKDGKATDFTNFAGGIPLIGGAARTRASSPAQQQYRQAQEDWVRAKLRKESGAAIGVDEMENEIKTYFPQPGETDGVVAQKRRARAIATEGMEKASGKAAYQSAVPEAASVSINPIFDAADAIIGGGNGKR